MKYLSTSEIAKKWNISERSVRNYCAQGRVEGAKLEGKVWLVPSNAEKPSRINGVSNETGLLEVLKREKETKLKGGIYHKIQVDLTYNSNHIEGSKLSHDQTRYIYETNTFENEKGTVNVDDIVETANHFRCIDLMIDSANHKLTESLIKKFHLILKSGTADSRKDWFAVGDYKRLANLAGGEKTAMPETVDGKIKSLLAKYNAKEKKTLEDIIDFHYQFEKIHPFQDGNGRVGRLIMFKECLKEGIVPFIIEDDLKLFYYRGLKEWKNEKGYLMDTCLTAQDRFKEVIKYFLGGK